MEKITRTPSLDKKIAALAFALFFSQGCGDFPGETTLDKNQEAPEDNNQPTIPLGHFFDVPDFYYDTEEFSLLGAPADVVLEIAGCASGLNHTFGWQSGNPASLYLYDTGCLASVAQFTAFGETFTSPLPFATTPGNTTDFSSPSGQKASVTTLSQIESPVSTTGESFSVRADFLLKGAARTVTTNKNIFRISPVTASVNEGQAFFFDIVRVTSFGAANVTVSWNISGCVTASDVSARSGSVIFAPADTSKRITVNALADALNERDETIVAAITASAGYLNYATASILVVDMDGPGGNQSCTRQ